MNEAHFGSHNSLQSLHTASSSAAAAAAAADDDDYAAINVGFIVGVILRCSWHLFITCSLSLSISKLTDFIRLHQKTKFTV
jgi:hypothetical protein